MMISFKKSMLLLCLFLSGEIVRAEVFTLWPFKSVSRKVSGGALAEALKGKVLWTEPVRINGVDLKLTLAFIETGLSESLFMLKSMYPDAVFSANSSSALVTVLDSDGTRKRIYLIEIGGDFPVIQFSMTLPDKLPDKFDWPSALPLPSGATPLTAMVFPDRGASYGAFSTNAPPGASLNEIASVLESSGWKSLTKSASNPSANGEVFIRKSPLGLFIVNYSNQPDSGVSTGTVYTRPVEKQP